MRNHLASTNLIEYLGLLDLFVYHGFTEFYLEGRWVKLTPRVQQGKLCHRHKAAPLEFDGREDFLFQEYDMENDWYMEIPDLSRNLCGHPGGPDLAAWYETYGRERVQAWIDAF